MAPAVVAPQAADDLARLIRTRSLPAGTRARLRHGLEPLRCFPRLGAPLEGRWAEVRFVLGPWRWMIVACAYDEESDAAAIVTIRDGRSSRAATAGS